MIGKYLYSLLAVVFWSGNFIIAGVAGGQISPVELSFYRWLTALFFLLPFLPSLLGSIRKTAIDKRTWILIVVLAATGVSAFNTFVYLAGQQTSSVNLSLIAITSPIFIAALNRFYFKQPTRLVTWLGVGLATTGCVVLILKGDLASLLALQVSNGDLLMLIAAILFAVYSALQRSPDGINEIEFLLLLVGIGVVILSPVYVAQIIAHGATPFTPTVAAYILYLGAFPSLAAFYLWNKSIKTIGAMRTGVVYYTIPVFVYLLDYLLHGTTVNLLMLVSFILIFTGVLIIHFTRTTERA